ncbi:uncharacterized protein LOC123895844 [Trifolium pratense]|uniref:uncharacterized protein LOC123895844 n=1 Tax=Trifolium pratense TaxID=57577 RepID=UPI001E694DDD|nr:uncharacterized protein LOC123895844 [Trifolium pratense]
MSSAYHPETDGQTDVINRCLESYLRCFASDQPKSWSSWIAWAEYWYNTTYHVSIGKTPFEVVYGRQAPSIVRFSSNETKVAVVALELNERDEALNQLKLHLQKAQEQMLSYANKKIRDLCFDIGEWVFLKLRPHRQQSVIVAKVGPVAYKLQLPASSKIHPVFHVSLLKKAVGDYHQQGDLPKDLEIDDAIDVYPEQVVGARVIMKEGVAVHQSLIKWKGKSLDDVTWEDVEFLRNCLFFNILSSMGQFPKALKMVLFVHKYSGSMALDSAIPITLSYYFISSATMIYAQHLTLEFPEPAIDLLYPGIALFLVGIIGNFYHHYLLSKLRGKGEKEYKIPKGGLFDYANK